MPIIAGLMPVTTMRTIERCELLSGAPFPAALGEQFAAVADDPAAVRALGIEQASLLARRLLDEGAPGLHFITFNFAKATREVMANLALAPDSVAAGRTSGRRGRRAAAARRAPRTAANRRGTGSCGPGR